MHDQSIRPLGLLRLDYKLETGSTFNSVLDGSLLNPDTLGLPLISEMVEGAYVERVVAGDASLDDAYVAAAKRLVARGARMISSDCGFTIRHQASVAAAVDVPVVLSSLLLLQTLLRQFPAPAKIAVVTYDSTHCTPDLLAVENRADSERVIVDGIEGGQYWHEGRQLPPPPVDVDVVFADVSACVARMRSAHPDIAAILLECTAFPLAAKRLRQTTKLPVYDITTLCRTTLEASA
ncbi:AroM family protein [Rhizobium sp.]